MPSGAEEEATDRDLLPGDLVFFGTDPLDPATIHHVGMYVGQGLKVNAPFTGAQVRVEPLRTNGYVGATRPPPDPRRPVRVALPTGQSARPC